MNRGVLRFHVGRTPVAVQPWFWLIAVLFGLGMRSWQLFLLWVPILFISILLHEMGHATAYRRFGSSASIQMHGLGGSTYGHVDRSSHDLIVSLAGPAAGFALGIPVWLLVARNIGYWNFDGSLNLLGAAAGLLFWVNVLWGVFNLLPVLPLDGGKALDAGLFMVKGHSMMRTTQTVSIVAASVALALATYAWLFRGQRLITWAILLLGLFLWANIHAYRRFKSTAGSSGQAMTELFTGMAVVGEGPDGMRVEPRSESEASVVDLSRERKRRRRSQGVKDDIAAALDALERHNHQAALEALGAARKHKAGARTTALLDEIEAWAQLAQREPQMAEQIMSNLPKRQPGLPYLLAGASIVRGDTGAGASAMAQAMLEGADDHSKLLAVELTASEGATEEVARNLLSSGSAGFEETMRLQVALKRLGRSGHASIVDDVILGGA